jgi:N-acetylmuramoyl-L-alanine amidase
VLTRRRLGFGAVFRLVVAMMLLAVILLIEILALSQSLTDLHGKGRSARILSIGEPLDPIAFAVGACMAFGPTTGNRHETVFLDAGHGGVDPGGIGITQSGHTIYEADATLPVELDAMGILRTKGFRVVVSRTEDSTVLRLKPADVSNGVLTLQGSHDDVAARDICANDAHASVLVGIYFDASGSPQGAGSVTAYDTERPFAASNLKLANLLQSDELAAMDQQGWNIPNDGVLPDTGLGSYVGDPTVGGIAGEAAAYDHLLLIGPAMTGYFSTPSQIPGAVAEPLYISDPFEGTIAANAHDQMVIAQGISAAVETFLAPSPALPTTRASSS